MTLTRLLTPSPVSATALSGDARRRVLRLPADTPWCGSNSLHRVALAALHLGARVLQSSVRECCGMSPFISFPLPSLFSLPGSCLLGRDWLPVVGEPSGVEVYGVGTQDVMPPLRPGRPDAASPSLPAAPTSSAAPCPRPPAALCFPAAAAEAVSQRPPQGLVRPKLAPGQPPAFLPRDWLLSSCPRSCTCSSGPDSSPPTSMSVGICGGTRVRASVLSTASLGAASLCPPWSPETLHRGLASHLTTATTLQTPFQGAPRCDPDLATCHGLAQTQQANPAWLLRSAVCSGLFPRPPVTSCPPGGGRAKVSAVSSCRSRPPPPWEAPGQGGLARGNTQH